MPDALPLTSAAPSRGQPDMPPIRVFLVEDHVIFAEGLTALLDDEDDIAVVGHARTVAGAPAAVRGSGATVVVVDFNLPDGTGVELVSALRTGGDSTPALFLSGDDSDDNLLMAIEAGACGYLAKTQAAAHVVDAVRRAAEGETLVDPATLLALFRRRGDIRVGEAERRQLLDALTPREREILALMVEGLDNRAIAARLVIEYSTVRHHVGNVIGKLQAHSKLEAVARALKLRLLQE